MAAKSIKQGSRQFSQSNETCNKKSGSYRGRRVTGAGVRKKLALSTKTQFTEEERRCAAALENGDAVSREDRRRERDVAVVVGLLRVVAGVNGGTGGAEQRRGDVAAQREKEGKGVAECDGACARRQARR
ncbi:hypothetical protein PIB30_030493 [Stylosanthes scabra]|uniref:Uncharacterized protein n=1 Tax=Stylosanthes scabra TaxID=79078 RepID=A0ABU6WA40_9FABA|nr:hypothetical protein [Stylosanthes scabra]